MSRTFRRSRHRYEYRWVLRVADFRIPYSVRVLLDRNSAEGRRALARYHSDAYESVRSPAPRTNRRDHDHRIRTVNDRELRRWLANPEYDPVIDVRHRHGANWSYW
jgi:hypothetical protein